MVRRDVKHVIVGEAAPGAADTFPRWKPWVWGLAGAGVVVLLWLALVASEQTHVHEQVDVALGAARKQLRSQIATIDQTIHRVAAFAAKDPRSIPWQSSLRDLERDASWPKRFVIVDRDGHLIAAVPELADTAAMLDAFRRRGAFAPPTPPLRYIAQTDSAPLLATVGICDTLGECTGVLVTEMDLHRPVFAAVGDTIDGFHFAVSLGGAELIRTAPLAESGAAFAARDSTELSSVGLVMTMWPTVAMIGRVRSGLPSLVLVLGLIASGLAVMTLRLSQNTRASAEREAHARFNLALGRDTDGVWEWDIPTGSSTRGAELWRHLGYDPAEMKPVVATWSDLIHPDDRGRVDTSLASALSSRTQIYEAEYRVSAADGQWHDMMDRGRVVERAPDGAPVRVLGISADITDRRRREWMLREMESLSTMGRLAARVAHEINNPLGGIKNAFMLIKGAVPPTHPHFKYVGAIDREIERIAVITRQLYETYRPDQESSPTSAVRSVITDAVSFLEHVNRPRRVGVALDLAGAPSVVQVPAAMLRQCVYTLIQNAIDASPDGSTIEVTGATSDGAFVLRVRDRGPGIHPGARRNIFEPFARDELGVPTDGVALGLALVRRSVQSLGGQLTLEEPAGGGAEFVVRFPIKTPAGDTP